MEWVQKKLVRERGHKHLFRRVLVPGKKEVFNKWLSLFQNCRVYKVRAQRWDHTVMATEHFHMFQVTQVGYLDSQEKQNLGV